MLILLNKLVKYNTFVCGYQVYDTKSSKLIEVQNTDNCYIGDLSKYPKLDWYNCSITSNKEIVLLGYAIINNKKFFVISFGTNRYYLVVKNYIIANSKVIVNAFIDKKNSVRFFHNKPLPCLSKFFQNYSFEYLGDISSSQSGSTGLGKKFIGRCIKTGEIGVVKFPFISAGEYNDCKNELICYHLGKLFQVPCCKVIEGSVNNNYCIMSVYQYNPLKECILSFRKVLSSLGYCTLNLKVLYNKYGNSFINSYFKVIIFDYITCQADRHLSNISIYKDEIYPLYDNGRSLMFGLTGNPRTKEQINIISKISLKRIQTILRQDVSKDDIANIFSKYYNNYKDIIDELYSRYISVKSGDLYGKT